MDTPFYEEWWFLLVVALASLIVLLLVAFTLVLHGQSKKYKNCGTGGPPARVLPLPSVPWAPERPLSASLSQTCRAHIHLFILLPVGDKTGATGVSLEAARHSPMALPTRLTSPSHEPRAVGASLGPLGPEPQFPHLHQYSDALALSNMIRKCRVLNR